MVAGASASSSHYNIIRQSHGARLVPLFKSLRLQCYVFKDYGSQCKISRQLFPCTSLVFLFFCHSSFALLVYWPSVKLCEPDPAFIYSLSQSFFFPLLSLFV